MADFQDTDDFPKIAHFNALSDFPLISARKIFAVIGKIVR